MKQKNAGDNQILRAIKNRFPYLDLNYLKFFRRVYYPIAQIGAGIQMETFEDFSVVERSVLQLIGLGIPSVEEIADLLGLTATYVSEVITVLQDYEHVDENLQITLLGTRCLREERKIRFVETRQTFHVDAVNGFPLWLDQTVDPEGMKLQQELHWDDLALIHLTEVPVKELLEGFQNAFSRRREGRFEQVLHINARKLSDAELEGFLYGRAYLLLLEGFEPMIFAKINTVKGQSVSYEWQPVAVMDFESARLLQWENPVYFSDRGKKLVREVTEDLIKRAEKDTTREKFEAGCKETLETKLLLSPEGYDRVAPFWYRLRSEAFTRLTVDGFRLLAELGSVNNVCPWVKKEWGGNVLKFVRDLEDRKLAYVCQYLKKRLDEEKIEDLYKMVSPHFSEEKEVPVIDEIARIFHMTLPE